MNDFLKTNDGFETTLKLIETINRSTDDYLFIWDIASDKRWFFGNIDEHYDIRTNGEETNSTPEMMRVIHPADREAVLASLKAVAEGKKDTHNMDYRWINRRGEKIWINCHGNVIRDKKNKPHLLIGRVSEENLRHLFNPLTSLWNKNKLRLDLKGYLKESKGYLLFLDIDALAAINLSHGRTYGDLLLKEIAEFCENMKEAKAAYHIDHNYFALVLDTDSEEGVRAAYSAVQNAMLEKCTFTGAAVPINSSLFLDENRLLDSINMTLKKAKEFSGGRLEFFSPEDLSKKISAWALLEELKLSIENDFEGFEVYYQPQVRAGNYDIYGVEALLRYNSKSRGRVFPNEFIPVLEESRLILDVGLWVLKKALEQCKIWREHLPNLRISVNFSALQFEDPALAEKVLQTIHEVEIESSALTIELTESMELQGSSRLLQIIKHLKQYGINFAIDDFGTGYSNLGYLKQLEIDEIKIDRVFVSGVEKGTYNHKLISNLIEFAKTNAIRTCCEGVENAHELVTLEFLLPDIIQGYLFDKPCTAEMIEKTYIDRNSGEYSARLEFVKKLNEFKDEIGVLHFDPKDILRENEVGLWMMRIKKEQNHYELHVDEIMEKSLAMEEKCTPKKCYEHWIGRIHPDYFDSVQKALDKMIREEKAVQIEFPWLHPKLGDVMVRLSGKRAKGADGMVILEGYYRIINDLAGA